MKVALVSPPFESVPPQLYGGTERVVYNLCRGLMAENIDVTLFASADSKVFARVIPIAEKGLRLMEKSLVDSIPYSIAMTSLVAKYAGEFDVIHNHHDYWMLPLAKISKTPLVTTLHGRLDLPGINAAFSAFPEVSYVSISDSQRTRLEQINWLRTIYHGVDLNDFEFHPEPGKYLAFLGRISEDKRPEWAIEIAKTCGVPLKIAAKIEGTVGCEYYDARVKRHVDGRFIEYLGEIAEREKSEFLGNALALVFPIDWPEPFGLVVIESLACGTPVLARPCGSVPELLKDGITGYSHLNLRELAARVSDMPRINRRICREWVKERFSLKRMTEEYIDVYRSLARNNRDGTPDHRGDLLHSVKRTARRNSKNFLQRQPGIRRRRSPR